MYRRAGKAAMNHRLGQGIGSQDRARGNTDQQNRYTAVVAIVRCPRKIVSVLLATGVIGDFRSLHNWCGPVRGAYFLAGGCCDA